MSETLLILPITHNLPVQTTALDRSRLGLALWGNRDGGSGSSFSLQPEIDNTIQGKCLSSFIFGKMEGQIGVEPITSGFGILREFLFRFWPSW